MLRRLALSLALASLIPAWSRAAEAFKATAPNAAPSGDIIDFDPELDPPPGTPADLVLWKAGRQVTFDAHFVRRRSNLLQSRALSQDLLGRLAAAAKGQPADEAKRLTALEEKLRASWSQNNRFLNRRWPVDPTRGCGVLWLGFDSTLRAAADGSPRADLVSARMDLDGCVRRLRIPTDALGKSNAELEALVVEAEKALSAAPKASQPRAGQAAGAPPAGTR